MGYLPNEIWHRIVGYVQAPLEPSYEEDVYTPWVIVDTLHSLCRTSRLLNQIALPYLYRSFPGASIHSHEKLLATLSERPDLAKLVRRIDTASIRLEKPVLHNLFLKARQNMYLPQHSKDRLEAFLSTGTIEQHEDVAFELLVDAITVFCIGLFPNLECVDFVIGDVVELSGILGSLVQRPLLQDPVVHPSIESVAGSELLSSDNLTSLRQIRVLDSNPEIMTEVSKLEDLLFLPCLQKFYGTSIHWDSTLTQAIPGCSLGLTEVILDFSVIDSSGFQDLLALCPLLTILRIDWAAVDGYEWHLELDGMGDSLREFGTHLQDLSLHCGEIFQSGMGDHTGWIGSLHDVGRLRRLTVSPGMLLGKGFSEYEDDSPVDSPVESDEDVGEQPSSIESLLPEGLEYLALYFRNPKMGEVHRQMDNILTSERLTRLSEVNVSGAGDWEQKPTKPGWKIRRTFSQSFNFSR